MSDELPRPEDQLSQDQGLHAGLPAAGAPSEGAHDDVLDLIRRADDHDLGRAFLVRGAQDAVAATFGVHAFLVDAARDHLAPDHLAAGDQA